MEDKEEDIAEGVLPNSTKVTSPFTEVTSRSPEHATEVLFEKALAATGIENQDRVRANYERVKRSWGSTMLVEDTEAVVRDVVRRNLQRIASERGFEEFSIIVDDSDVKCAQVNAFVAGGFVAVRVWCGSDKLYACGDSLFTR